MPNPTSYDELINTLHRACSRYEVLKAHFDRFCTQAKRLEDDPQCPLRGIAVEVEALAVRIAFLDRRIRISLRFDRQESKGVLQVEDISATESLRPAATIDRIAFDGTGETGLRGDMQATP